VIITGNTWDQISVVLKGLLAGRAKGYLKPGIRFEGGRMRGQRSAIFDIVAGPGKGGELRAASFTAGAKNIAGPRAEAIFSDEPLPEAMYNELIPRLFGRRGHLYVTYTPTLGTSQRLDYLWRAVDDPALPYVGEIHTPLTLDAVTPRGGRIELPWACQDEIDQFGALVSPVERAMRMGLSRHPRMDTAYFGDIWGPHLIGAARPPDGTRVGIGMDHGSKPGAERVVLVAVDGRSLYAHVWVMDEWSGSSHAGARAVAQAILDMLQRNNLDLPHVDFWVGDRAHRGDRKGGAMSNDLLKQAFADIAGLDTRRKGWRRKLPRALQRLWPPAKALGSDYEGMGTLRRLMMGDPTMSPPVPPQITIHPRCVKLQEDIERWQGSRTDPHKDGLDALRYVVVEMTDQDARAAA